MKILFNCLLKKGVVIVECDGWCFFYVLVVLEEVWVVDIGLLLIDCLFGGCLVLLVV